MENSLQKKHKAEKGPQAGPRWPKQHRGPRRPQCPHRTDDSWAGALTCAWYSLERPPGAPLQGVGVSSLRLTPGLEY
jgi:hypothetical protein